MSALMKGHVWSKHKHKMTYPAWVEIKIDEIRCRVQIDATERTVQYHSFAGNDLANMHGFDAEWLDLHDLTGYTNFDTGFEVNGNFNDSYRWVRSTSGAPPELVDAKKHFILFDLPEIGDQPFEKRMNTRHHVAVLAASFDFDLYQPAGSWAHEEASVEQMFIVARERGHEGLMVKSLQHLYQPGKRSYGWLKFKPSDDADGVIMELHEAVSEHGEPLGRTGSITLLLEDGSKATPHGIAHELGRDMHANPQKFIGQWAEFKYMERDRQGGYRHPIFYRLREAKA
jgi:hypothetical protein